jgi:pimeloyl-ACP methyl ester carboxylesterase
MQKFIITIFTFLLVVSAGAQKSESEFDGNTFFKNFSQHTVKVNGNNLHYVSGGNAKEVMLLLHGWPEMWYEWRKMMPLLTRQYTVIAPDLRGAGESAVTDSGYDKKTLAQDIHGLMKQLGYNKAIVIGHDWGASVAYAYAAQYPEAVSKLVIAEGGPFGHWMPNIELYWYFTFMRLPNDYAEKVTKGNEREYLTWFYQTSKFHFVKGAISDADVTYYLRYFKQAGRMTAGFNFYRTIDQDVADNSEWAKTPLTMPVLAVGAEHGAKKAIAESMKQVAKNVSSVVMNNTGHFIPEERPEEFTKIIFDFINNKLPENLEWAPEQ